MKLKTATILAAAMLSGSANAADFNTRSSIKSADSPWDGWYAGVNIGYGWSNNTNDVSYLPNPVDFEAPNQSFRSKSSSSLGGAQIGFNRRTGSGVFGFEADIQGANFSHSDIVENVAIIVPNIRAALVVPNGAIGAEQKLSWFGTLRGRYGFTVAPTLLLYGTAGLAFGQVEDVGNTVFTDQNSFPGHLNNVRLGWTAGAGAEWLLSPGWSAKLEYLRLDFGNPSITSSSTDALVSRDFQAVYRWHHQYDVVRIGLNYHFR